ncbi:MAG TPA: hypothetical protein VE377_21740 [Candidatus Dormibacteraeota bacterium]|nr:hypothetical protein [Candidatus Dormibacteraeota bacterium]
MESFGHFVSQHFPGPWTLLAWCVAVLGLVAVISIPAYFIFYPIATNVRRGVAFYLSQLSVRHASARESRRRDLEASIQEFRSNSGISQISERITRLEAVLASFSEIAKALKPHFDRLLGLPRVFERIGNRLTDAASKVSPVFPDLPSADQLAAQHGSLRTAKTRLIVSSVILIALISVNTGMLGQILRDIGFIPHDLIYFGVHLYLVFAFILTLAEAGLGYLHTAGRPTPDEPSRVAAWPVIASCFAVVIACVEGFFYSLVAPSRESLVDLPIGYQIKQGTLFFLWGATLVLVLFGLGTIWSTALERITRSSDHFPALVKRLTDYREKFAAACEGAATSAGQLRKEVDSVRQSFQGAAQEASSLAASLKAFEDATSIKQLEADAPRPLTTAEAYHFTHLSGLWLLLTVFGVFFVAANVFYAVVYSFPYLANPAPSFVSLGLAACFLVLGLLVPRGELLLDGAGNRRIIVSGSPWMKRITSALGIMVALAFIALLWRVRLARYQSALWIVILILGCALAAAASQARATGKGLRIWFNMCGSALLTCIEATIRLCGRVFLAAAYCIEGIALAFAAPIFLIRGRELPSLHTVEEPKRQTLTAA